MGKAMDQNNRGLRPGDHITGYVIKRIVELKHLHSFFYELDHAATGARHIHISNRDRENTFSVAFKTVPKDSTGVAHILEHTVLCGSDKFPVRDPFFSMLKRSLTTFMNAFTASDWTMYPFSTQNGKDFYNLLDVYLDAVFFPIIEELSFKQEGHRLDFENRQKDGDDVPLVYKGVVYNEMKGAMSSPDQVMARSLLKALYPGTTYSHNSGGDPAVIPSLTYDQLKAFHRQYYHPSNAFFYTYGDLPLKHHLSFIQEKILKRFDRIDPDSQVPAQPRWNRPQTASFSYPLDKNEDPSKKHQVCVAWLTADIKDTLEVLVLTLLEQILMGNAACPLRKALIDSQLGTALCDAAGYDAENRDTMFVCGLKGTEASAGRKIEKIIFDVLNKLVAEGIDHRLIESAIHQVEFHRKEVTNSPYPFGLKQLLVIAGGWLHEGDPLSRLMLDKDLEKIRRALSKGGFFEDRIKKYFLKNTHRVLFTLVPDQEMAKMEGQRVAAELENIKAKLSSADLEKLSQDAEALQQLQETDEDLSSLPTLAREDIPVSVPVVAASESFEEVPAACYQQPTSGIFYYAMAAGAGLLAKELVPLVPFFCYALPKMGTSLRDYSDMSQRIDLYTGGVGLSAQARSGFDVDGSCVPLISFTAKCLVRNQPPMFEIIEELLTKFDFSDLSRLKNILLEYRSNLETMIIHNGHRLAITRASRNFSTTRLLNELWSGIHLVQTIKTIADDLSASRLASLGNDLTAIGKNLFRRQNVEMALIGEEVALHRAVAQVTSMHKRLNGVSDSDKSSAAFSPPQLNAAGAIPREGWSTSSAVSFVAQSFETVRMDHRDAAALAVIAKILRSLYLHREIREKGGAYGGFAVYNTEDGIFSFASYRDPHIVSTLNIYNRAADFIRSGEYTQEDINEAVLQVCSDIDKPDAPGAAACKAFYRRIISLSDETRQDYKERVLSLTRRQVLKTAEKYFDSNNPRRSVAVISSEAALNSANRKLSSQPLELYRI
ncbi:MAG: insulinase family protein [Desulfobacterales bacterium]